MTYSAMLKQKEDEYIVNVYENKENNKKFNKELEKTNYKVYMLDYTTLTTDEQKDIRVLALPCYIFVDSGKIAYYSYGDKDILTINQEIQNYNDVKEEKNDLRTIKKKDNLSYNFTYIEQNDNRIVVSFDITNNSSIDYSFNVKDVKYYTMQNVEYEGLLEGNIYIPANTKRTIFQEFETKNPYYRSLIKINDIEFYYMLRSV